MSSTQQVDQEPVAWYAAVGLLQGLCIWASWHLIAHPVGKDVLSYFAVAAPAAWYLGARGFGSNARRVVWAVLIGLLMAGLAAHATVTQGRSDFDRIVASGTLAFALVPLGAGFDVAARRFSYPKLFELAWRNALLVPLAGLLTGIFWVLVQAATWLMNSVGVHALEKALEKPLVHIVLVSTVFGLATGLVLRRADTLVAVRRFWLALNAWFLPLALLFAAVSVVALAAMGTSGLFATHKAAFYLLWFVVLAVVFMNAAFQDGREAPTFPRVLSRALPWLWLCIAPLTLVGLWALGLRVQQHGWTPDRVWAAVVAVVVAIHAFGYAASLLNRSSWMSALPQANIVAAIVKCLLLALLLSPLADVRGLSVHSQLGRLQSGAASVSDFDWAFLDHRAGTYGKDGLKWLAEGDAQVSAEVRQHAAAVLRDGTPDMRQLASDPQKALRALQEELLVLPRTARPDPALLAWFVRSDANWFERSCAMQPDRCALWLVDLNADGKNEAVLLFANHHIAQTALYAQGAKGWQREGDLNGANTLKEWTEAIEQGQARVVAPQWMDVDVNGTRARVDTY